MKKLLHTTSVQILGGIAVLALITWGSASLLSKHAQNFSTVHVSSKDMVETVSAIGSVKADQEVTLAFDMQGKVAAVYARVGDSVHTGDSLAALNSGTLVAQLDGARADLAAANAKLADMESGARPEEVALYEQKYSDASVALIASMKAAYLQVEDAIIGKADSLFNNGDTVNPTISIRTESEIQKNSIQGERVALRDKLASWKQSLDSLNASNPDTARSVTSDTMATAKAFLDDLAVIGHALSTANSGQSQTTIDSQRSIINAASQEVSGAISSEQAVDAAWSASRDSLTLERSGATTNALAAQEALVAKAQAVVEGIQTQLGHSVITAPFDGVVTRMDLKIGEVYVPGISAGEGIGLISSGAYKVEVYVPETDVAKIALNNPVAVTLDAYGSGIVFPATVSLIDPAQTIQNGVGAYKTTVVFKDVDPRIRAGMTANVSITTKSLSSVLAVPSSAIITRGTDKFVLVKDATGAFSEHKVETGIESSDGFTQIVSGLGEGDIIAAFGTN